MNSSNRDRIIRLLIGLLWAVLFIACDGTGGTSGPNPDLGSVVFNLIWTWNTNNNTITKTGTCQQDVNAISAYIYDSKNVLVASGGQWSCPLIEGTINNIAIGSDYYMIVEAQDSGGYLTWIGEVANFNASAGIVTNVGTVTMRTVSEVVSIAVTPANLSISPGSSQQFTATLTFDDNGSINVTPLASWTSSNEGAVTINAAGLATSLTVGSSTITATFAGLSNATTIKVSD